MDDAELAALRASGAFAQTRITPPPAVGSAGARRTPAASAFAAPAATAHAPRGAATPAPTASTARSNIELVLSGGERVRVAGRGVIGRDPSEAPGAYVHRIALADPDKLLSRAHLEFGLDGNGAFWISDLHSTNGALVERRGQAQQRCLPGYRVAIEPGDRVTFGGRILTIEVG
ncbi:MAG: FHA domain-containing protein [Actinomycetota bacterium]|nr:FHA domain-containing protein [Actinomycetota bacterium]